MKIFLFILVFLYSSCSINKLKDEQSRTYSDVYNLVDSLIIRNDSILNSIFQYKFPSSGLQCKLSPEIVDKILLSDSISLIPHTNKYYNNNSNDMLGAKVVNIKDHEMINRTKEILLSVSSYFPKNFSKSCIFEPTAQIIFYNDVDSLFLSLDFDCDSGRFQYKNQLVPINIELFKAKILFIFLYYFPGDLYLLEQMR